MTPASLTREVSSLFSAMTQSASNTSPVTSTFNAPQRNENSKSAGRGIGINPSKIITMGTAGATIALALQVPTARAQNCPAYCYRSYTQDQMKISIAGALCAEFGPAAVIACAAAARYAQEHDKQTCAEMNCGPFMSP